MSESIKNVDFYNFHPTREQRAEVYIGDSLCESDRVAAQDMATDFEKDQPMHHTAVFIPVAAHQDGNYIFNTMGLYAQQRNCDPFSIFLYLNAPFIGAHESSVDASRQEVARAAAAFPNLDIRVSTVYHDDETIGSIRRDLWNAGFLLAHHEGLFKPGSPEVIGINNDIDTHTISPHYISRIQSFYRKRQKNNELLGIPEAPCDPIGTRVSHAVLPSHPNVGKVTQWVDNTLFQYPGHAIYEAGKVIPLSHYAVRGGFNPNARIHETGWVSGSNDLRLVTGAQLQTSPRRYIDRLLQHGREGIWTAVSFGPTDECRNDLGADISHEQAESIILDTLQQDLELSWLPGGSEKNQEATMGLFYILYGAGPVDYVREQARIAVQEQLLKAERFMRLVIKSDVLGDIVRDQVVIESYVDSLFTVSMSK